MLVTPGHTDGASCFLVGKHLFSGDTLFPGGPGKTRSPEALATILENITSKLLTLPDDVLVYPGHGDDTTVAEARRRHAVYASKDHPAELFGDIDCWRASRLCGLTCSLTESRGRTPWLDEGVRPAL